MKIFRTILLVAILLALTTLLLTMMTKAETEPEGETGKDEISPVAFIEFVSRAAYPTRGAEDPSA